ncbi:MAG TPA: HDOD domain-containing protein [Deltaproteobacteria bacterium]|nr:HDOD domain-containing protein [Deltaproteobacteria bacterium]
MDNEKIIEMIEETCELPPVPIVASKVLKLVNDPNSTVSQLEEAIVGDSNMVSRIIGMANSAYYVRVHKVKTLKAAINVLGYKALANLVIAASTRQFYAKFGLVEKLLWEHSVGTAIAAAVLATEFKAVKSDEALVGGLLHDIGKTIINLSKPDDYRDIAEEVYNGNGTYFDVEQEKLGFAHSDVGSYLIQKWNFPVELGKAIYYHHSINEIDPSMMDPFQVKYICIIDVANHFTKRLGVGYREPDDNVDIGSLKSLELLGVKVSQEDIDVLTEKIAKVIEEEKSKFD